MDIQNHVETMYLTSRERKVIDDMTYSLDRVKRNSDNMVLTNAVIDYFVQHFENKGQNFRNYPITTPEGEVVAYEYVPDIHYMCIDIERIWEFDYSNPDNDVSFNDDVKRLMNTYAVKFGEQKDAFSDINISKIVSESDAQKKYDLQKKDAKEKIAAFMTLKMCKDMVKDA